MSHIFGRARCVLDCVGMHQDDSGVLAYVFDDLDAFLTARRSRIDDVTERATHSGTIPKVTTSISENPQGTACAQHCFEWVKQLSRSTTSGSSKLLTSWHGGHTFGASGFFRNSGWQIRRAFTAGTAK